MYIGWRTTRDVIFLLVVCTLSSALWADDKLYVSKCAACHGQEGEGSALLKAPSIAGLDEAYLLRQLNHFKNGIRGSSEADPQGLLMAEISQALAAEEIEQVTNYLASKPFVAAPTENKATSFRAAGLFRSCKSCHGAKGEGEPSLNAPRIAGQYAWYLNKQIKDFRSGIRGNHAEDKYGKQMANIAASLNNEADTELLILHAELLKPDNNIQKAVH